MHAVLLEWLPGFWLPASLRQSCLEISTTPVPSFPLMESGEVAGTVNLDSFTLDFMERDPNEGAWDEEGERILDNEDVLAQMLGELLNTCREQGYLNLGRTAITCVSSILLNYSSSF